MGEGKIRIGIGGWTYAPWRGVFYPDRLPQSKELDYASEALRAIEINATFYGRQKAKDWEMWAKAGADEFQFAVKGSRFCVMKTKLAETGEGLGGFFGQGLAALGPKLGPILWQFASRRKFDRDDIAAFIDLLPEELDGLIFATRSSPVTTVSTTRSSSTFAVLATSRSSLRILTNIPASKPIPPISATPGCSG